MEDQKVSESHWSKGQGEDASFVNDYIFRFLKSSNPKPLTINQTGFLTLT